MYMYIVIISFLLSVQNKIKYNLWISMNNFTNSNMKSRGMNFSPSNIIRKERKDAVAKNRNRSFNVSIFKIWYKTKNQTDLPVIILPIKSNTYQIHSPGAVSHHPFSVGLSTDAPIAIQSPICTEQEMVPSHACNSKYV